MRTYATSVCGLKLRVYEATRYLLLFTTAALLFTTRNSARSCQALFTTLFLLLFTIYHCGVAVYCSDAALLWQLPLETALEVVKTYFRTHPKFSLTPTVLLLQRHASQVLSLPALLAQKYKY